MKIAQPKTQTRVAILGAGMAGLVAGYELQRAGYEIIILEARDAPGGRVRTLRDGLRDGMMAEAGATYLPVSHTLTGEYLTLAGVELISEPLGAKPFLYFLKNKRYAFSKKIGSWFSYRENPRI